MVNILLNNILVQRGLIAHEQKWDDGKMVKTPRDEITIGTEHWRSDEWKGKGRITGAKLKPDLVWLRRDSGVQWKKVVLDVKVTSTDDMNKAKKEKDHREWATKRDAGEESIEGRDGAPVIAHDGAVHRENQAKEEYWVRH